MVLDSLNFRMCCGESWDLCLNFSFYISYLYKDHFCQLQIYKIESSFSMSKVFDQQVWSKSEREKEREREKEKKREREREGKKEREIEREREEGRERERDRERE